MKAAFTAVVKGYSNISIICYASNLNGVFTGSYARAVKILYRNKGNLWTRIDSTRHSLKWRINLVLINTL